MTTEQILEMPEKPIQPEVVSEPQQNKNYLKIILLVILGLVIMAGAVYAGMQIGKKQVVGELVQKVTPTPIPQPTEIPTPDETANWKTYTNIKYGFEIKYPGEAVDVKNDNEIEYSRESKIDIPNGFTEFMGYKPPKLVTAIKVTDKTSSSSSYAFVPFFNVWVFDNSKGISIDQWYMSYWYYPFNWGQAIESIIESDRPKYTKTVNNTEIKYAISDDMGPVEYGYASQNRKMLLFVIRGKLGNQILSTFKFIDQNQTKFTCPQNGWVDCMPILDEEKKIACSKEAEEWYKTNCSDFKGFAQ